MPVQALLAASLLAAPLPNLARQAGPAEYPSDYLRTNKSAAALIELVITPQGTVAQCRLLQSFGDKKFASELCRFQRKKAWHHAVGANGEPIYGVVRSVFRMFIPGTRQGDEVAGLSQPPDILVSVNRLPPPTAGYLDVNVSLEVDALGVVNNCEARREPTISDSFTGIACAQARQLKFAGVSIDGVALPSYAMQQKVRFVMENPVDATN